MLATGFVLLEITQPEIRSLLWRMQWILSGTAPRHPVHVTLRGPYVRRIAPEILDKSRELLCSDTLRIGGVGRFRKPEEVVFLRVDSPNLRKVCWKPDYPKKDGYEPHISLYRGRDAAFAARLADFLAREALEFSCAEYKLWVHRRASLHLESREDRAAAFSEAGVSFGSGQAEPQLLARLRQFLDDYKASSPSQAVAPAGRQQRNGGTGRGGAWFTGEDDDLHRP